MALVTREQLGQRLKAMRAFRKLTQEALAERADLSTDTVRRVERGKFTASFDTLVKLADGLDMSLSEFLADERDEVDDLATLIRELPEDYREVAHAVVGTLHVQAALH